LTLTCYPAQGKDAYARALRNSQKYFDYLIERARTQFLSERGCKVKAVNYCCPHPAIPSRIAATNWPGDGAKMGIDSSVLRQELKHVAQPLHCHLKALAESSNRCRKILFGAGLATEMQTLKTIFPPWTARKRVRPCPPGAVCVKSERLHLAGHGVIDRSPARHRSETMHVTDLPYRRQTAACWLRSS